VGDLARAVDVFDGLFPVGDDDKADMAYQVAAHAHDAVELAALASMLALPAESFEAAWLALARHKAGHCPPEGHRGWSCGRS